MKQIINKPNFLCVGATKTGTSSMHQILKQHQEIYLPSQKESFFFERNYNKGIEWYLKLFDNVANEKAIGEICPTYLYLPECPARIFKELDKEIKLIFIFRNPADKMFSNYKMNKSLFNEKNTFKQAIELDKIRIKEKIIYHETFHYIKKGYYDKQVKRYLEFFDKKNMLFLIYETDIKQNPKQTYAQIQDFLGVSKIELFTDVNKIPGQKNKSKKIDKLLNTANPINQFAKKLLPNKQFRMKIKETISKFNKNKIIIDNSELEEQKAMLINDIYKESILNLEKIINKDLSHWKT